MSSFVQGRSGPERFPNPSLDVSPAKVTGWAPFLSDIQCTLVMRTLIFFVALFCFNEVESFQILPSTSILKSGSYEALISNRRIPIPGLQMGKGSSSFLRRASQLFDLKAVATTMNSGGSLLEKSKTVSPAPLPKSDTNKDKEKQYHVLLFNDPVNTREYVCSVLVQVFGHSRGEAYNIMQQAHSQGFSICNTTGKDEADTQCAALKSGRLMSSVIEAD